MSTHGRDARCAVERRKFLAGLSVLSAGALVSGCASREQGVPTMIGIARFVDGKWQQGWYFGAELGLMLQLGASHMLG